MEKADCNDSSVVWVQMSPRRGKFAGGYLGKGPTEFRTRNSCELHLVAFSDRVSQQEVREPNSSRQEALGLLEAVQT